MNTTAILLPCLDKSSTAITTALPNTAVTYQMMALPNAGLVRLVDTNTTTGPRQGGRPTENFKN